MLIRCYKSSDLKYVMALYYETVHVVNAKDYSLEQVNAWAPDSFDCLAWDQSLLNSYSIVALENEQIVGFGDVNKTGYLNRLYVHKDFQRRGIATKLCHLLESRVTASKIKVHASITAKPFFESRGYKVMSEQQVTRNGVFLTNYVMEKLRAV